MNKLIRVLRNKNALNSILNKIIKNLILIYINNKFNIMYLYLGEKKINIFL